MKNNSEFIALWTHLCTFEETRFLTQPPRKKKKTVTRRPQKPADRFFSQTFWKPSSSKDLRERTRFAVFFGGRTGWRCGETASQHVLMLGKILEFSLPVFFAAKNVGHMSFSYVAKLPQTRSEYFHQLEIPEKSSQTCVPCLKGGQIWSLSLANFGPGIFTYTRCLKSKNSKIAMEKKWISTLGCEGVANKRLSKNSNNKRR